MTDVCLTLLTGQQVRSGGEALERIWSLDNWASSVGRVCRMEVSVNDDTRQKFRLWFDAGRPTPDEVEVERTRDDAAIDVFHHCPPPGIRQLSARWWVEPAPDPTLYARRRIILDAAAYSPDRARQMFRLMKENMAKLMGATQCDPA